MPLRIVETLTSPFYSVPPEEKKESQTTDKVASLSNVLKVAAGYVTEPTGLREMIVEPVYYSLRWVEIIVFSVAEMLAGPKAIVEGFNQFLIWVELPDQILKVVKSVAQLGESLFEGSFWKTVDKTAKVYVNGTYTIGVVSDALLLFYQEHLIHLSSVALTAVQVLGLLGNFALLIDAGRGLKKQIVKLIESEPWSPAFNLALIRLIENVALAVVAGFSIAGFFSAAAFCPYVILIFAIVLLLLKLAAHFYEKTHLPDKPEKEIIANS